MYIFLIFTSYLSYFSFTKTILVDTINSFATMSFIAMTDIITTFYSPNASTLISSKSSSSYISPLSFVHFIKFQSSLFYQFISLPSMSYIISDISFKNLFFTYYYLFSSFTITSFILIIYFSSYFSFISLITK